MVTDMICANCGKPESEHAGHGDWCPVNSEDELFSKVSKFSSGELHTCSGLRPNDMVTYSDGPCDACAASKNAEKLDTCKCGHLWEQHDNDYPYACWADVKGKSCKCQNWNRAVAEEAL